MSNLFDKYIISFLTNPKKVFWIYVIVNLLPSLFLVYTEPYTLAGKAILLLFPIGLYFILFSLSGKTSLLQLILFPLLILHAFQIVIFYLFGEGVIAVDMFLNVITTNPSEACELLESILPAVIFVALIYIPVLIIAGINCKKKVFLSLEFRKRVIIWGVSLMFLSFALSFIAKNKNTDAFTFHDDVYPTDMLYNLCFAIHKTYKINHYPESSKDFTFGAVRTVEPGKREIYVLIVGETSRAENWSLYDYKRDTNPQLKQENVICFKDVITQSNTTHKSVPIILSAASAENFDCIYKQKSIIQAFNEIGFTTLFLSNQMPNHSFIDCFADEAHCRVGLRSAFIMSKTEKNSQDEELLSLLKSYIDSIPGNIFAVLHSYGSHFNYKERYTETFSRFKPDNVTEITVRERDKLINAYDNSILYTDDFISKAIALLCETNTCSALLYVSDHGEDILDDERNRFLHASPSPTFYQLWIPMLVWFSPYYQADYPHHVLSAEYNRMKPVSTNAVFHTLLDIAHIRTKYLNPELSLVNPSFKKTRRMYLDDHDKPIFFYKANLKKEDKEMIDKRDIDHE